MKYLIFLVMAAGLVWLAVDRHQIKTELEAVNARVATAEEKSRKFDEVLAKLNKVNPALAKALAELEAGKVGKVNGKTWLQERIEKSASALDKKTGNP